MRRGSRELMAALGVVALLTVSVGAQNVWAGGTTPSRAIVARAIHKVTSQGVHLAVFFAVRGAAHKPTDVTS
jgi:divalent metal cation (Fe/Co/Zn/Cd) transporter